MGRGEGAPLTQVQGGLGGRGLGAEARGAMWQALGGAPGEGHSTVGGGQGRHTGLCLPPSREQRETPGQPREEEQMASVFLEAVTRLQFGGRRQDGREKAARGGRGQGQGGREHCSELGHTRVGCAEGKRGLV